MSIGHAWEVDMFEGEHEWENDLWPAPRVSLTKGGAVDIELDEDGSAARRRYARTIPGDFHAVVPYGVTRDEEHLFRDSDGLDITVLKMTGHRIRRQPVGTQPTIPRYGIPTFGDTWEAFLWFESDEPNPRPYKLHVVGAFNRPHALNILETAIEAIMPHTEPIAVTLTRV